MHNIFSKYNIHNTFVLISKNFDCEHSDIITNNKNGVTEHVFDPNALYPEFPPNHPKTARLNMPAISKCPVENGVIKTTYVDILSVCSINMTKFK